MNSISAQMKSTLIVLAVFSSFSGSVTFADSVGSVEVMEVDDVRDAATIARAKARKRSESSGDEDDATFSSGGCSDLNIGNVKTGVGQPVPRNVTIVIEGPVVQENKCR